MAKAAKAKSHARSKTTKATAARMAKAGVSRGGVRGRPAATPIAQTIVNIKARLDHLEGRLDALAAAGADAEASEIEAQGSER